MKTINDNHINLEFISISIFLAFSMTKNISDLAFKVKTDKKSLKQYNNKSFLSTSITNLEFTSYEELNRLLSKLLIHFAKCNCQIYVHHYHYNIYVKLTVRINNFIISYLPTMTI